MTVPIGTWNEAIAILGPVGYGKSTLALARARKLARKAYVVAYDPKHTYEGPDVHRHKTADALLARLEMDGDGIHTLETTDGMAVLHTALRVASLSRANAREGAAVPTLLVWDEVVTTTGMTPSYVHPLLAEAYLTRRHLHLGFIWLTQRIQLVHPLLWDETREIVMFRVRQEKARKRLEEVGVDADIIAKAAKLPKFRHVSWHADA